MHAAGVAGLHAADGSSRWHCALNKAAVDCYRKRRAEEMNEDGLVMKMLKQPGDVGSWCAGRAREQQRCSRATRRCNGRPCILCKATQCQMIADTVTESIRGITMRIRTVSRLYRQAAGSLHGS